MTTTKRIMCVTDAEDLCDSITIDSTIIHQVCMRSSFCTTQTYHLMLEHNEQTRGGGGTNVTTQNCHLDDPSSLIAMIDDLTYLMPSGYWLHLHCFVHMSALWRMKVTGASHKWEKMKTRILKM